MQATNTYICDFFSHYSYALLAIVFYLWAGFGTKISRVILSGVNIKLLEEIELAQKYDTNKVYTEYSEETIELIKFLERINHIKNYWVYYKKTTKITVLVIIINVRPVQSNGKPLKNYKAPHFFPMDKHPKEAYMTSKWVKSEDWKFTAVYATEKGYLIHKELQELNIGGIILFFFTSIYM